MNKENKLKKIIEKAVEGGWEDESIGIKNDLNLEGLLISYGDYDLGIESIIFSHDFAKAFWGEETGYEEHVRLGYCHGHKDVCGFKNETKPIWQHHLQQMVLEGNPLNYLAKFLNE